MAQAQRLTAVARILDAVSAILFGAMFIMFCVEVFFRYVLNDPIGWSIEFILITFLIMLFWTVSFNVPLKKHVSFSVVYDLLPPKGKRVVRLATDLVGIGILVPALPGVANIVVYENQQTTPLLQLPLSVLYGGYALFLVSFAVRLAASAVRLIGTGWENEL